MEHYRPDPRRYTVSLTGSDLSAPVRWGDNHPNLLGWEIAWKMAHGSNNAQVAGLWTCREDWYHGQTLSYGDQNTGTLMNQGGRVFVPYSTISLQLMDGAGVGNVTCQVIGRPVMCGETPWAKSQLYGIKSFQAEAEGDATVSVPTNADMFAVARGELSSTPWDIQALGGAANRVYWAFQLEIGELFPGSVTGLPWRTCPPADASTTGTIKITNDDAAETASGHVWFRFDFNQGR